MDPRNLIFGEKPQFGNPVHIQEYKRRALRNAGDLPLVIRSRYFDYDLEADVYEWRCPKCGSVLCSLFDEDKVECNGYGCFKRFELRDNSIMHKLIYVVKEESENN